MHDLVNKTKGILDRCMEALGANTKADNAFGYGAEADHSFFSNFFMPRATISG